MNSYAIELQGKFELSEPLDIDTTYALGLEGAITAIKKVSQQDGSYCYIHVLKPTFGQVTTKGAETTKVLSFEKKRSQSHLLRNQLAYIATSRGAIGGEEIENFYQKTLTDLRHFLPQVIEYMDILKKEENGVVSN